VQRQEIAAVLRPLALEGELRDLAIGQASRQFVQRAQAGDVRNGLDVEDEHWSHGRVSVGKT
jgi:hypothetical protein